MPRKLVYPCATLVAGLLFAVGFLPGRGHAEPPGTEETSANDRIVREAPSLSHALFLPTDPDLPRKFDALQDLVKEKDWPKATHLLQSLLDATHEVWVPLRQRGAEGKETTAWTTARAEAERLLGALPSEGLEYYELAYGPQARGLLAEAESQSDPEELAAVARRFPHARAGREALDRLGTQHLDRGRPAAAALCFAQLLAGPAADRLPPLTLFKAFQARARSGDRAGAEQIWKRLAAAVPDGLRLGGRAVSLEQLRQAALRGEITPAEEAHDDWSVFRGSASRSARAGGPVSPVQVRWELPTWAETASREWLTRNVQYLESRAQPVLPTLFPVTAGRLLVCRSHRGITAVDGRSGKLAWEVSSPWALDTIAQDATDQAHVASWLDSYLREGRPEMLLNNSVLGTLSSDGKHVYAVEDLPVPPFPPSYGAFVGQIGQGLRLPFAPELTEAVYHNRLLAVDAATGKVVWDLGGHGSAADQEDSILAPPLQDTFFLGPPLPLHGKLYVLAETDQELRLLCLDPGAGAVVWSQTLAFVRRGMLLDGGRRIHAAPLVSAQGILLCPTNAGAIFAVDPLSRNLLWTHSYHEEPPPPPFLEMPRGRFRPGMRLALLQSPPNLSAEWNLSAPVVAEGMVVFTAPDEPSVHCVRLSDGRPLWRVPRDNRDLYLAGAVAGRALVVGRDGCRALDLADGKEVWRCDTGLPSGQGIFVGPSYFLPLKTAGGGKEPEVFVLDVVKGTVERHLRIPNGKAPGNLLFHEGCAFAQNATGVIAYGVIAYQETK
jgi:outer membrane protein assembly factor BamB